MVRDKGRRIGARGEGGSREGERMEGGGDSERQYSGTIARRVSARGEGVIL